MNDDKQLSLEEVFPAAYEQADRASKHNFTENFSYSDGAVVVNTAETPSVKMRMIFTLQCRGHPNRVIAQMMGLTEGTITRITLSDRYRQMAGRLLGEMDHEFVELKPLAFAAVRKGLVTSDENTALRAAEVWMKAAGFGQYNKAAGPAGLTAEDVAAQLLKGVNVQVNVQVNAGKSTDGE